MLHAFLAGRRLTSVPRLLSRRCLTSSRPPPMKTKQPEPPPPLESALSILVKATGGLLAMAVGTRLVFATSRVAVVAPTLIAAGAATTGVFLIMHHLKVPAIVRTRFLMAVPALGLMYVINESFETREEMRLRATVGDILRCEFRGEAAITSEGRLGDEGRVIDPCTPLRDAFPPETDWLGTTLHWRLPVARLQHDYALCSGDVRIEARRSLLRLPGSRWEITSLCAELIPPGGARAEKGCTGSLTEASATTIRVHVPLGTGEKDEVVDQGGGGASECWGSQGVGRQCGGTIWWFP